MSSVRSYGRRVGSLFAVAALVLATITPGLVPTLVSAAQLTERSIELSNSSAAMQGVSYKVSFKADGAAESVVLDFCENTPLIGASCTTPAGFSATGVTATGVTSVTANDANTVTVVDEIAEAEDVVFTLANINNPTSDGPLYVRILTYADPVPTYVDAENIGSDPQLVDQGGAAVSITDTVGVSGAVLESLTFCVSGSDPAGVAPTITDNCGGTLYPPTLELGETSGDVTALSSTVVSEGSIYTQLSTNAASGAIVNLKSSATGCGGLLRFGDTSACDIAPALATGIAAGEAKFGVKTTNPVGGLGVLSPIGDYNTTTFALGYDAVDQSTGVTSPFGDQFFNTNDAPVSNVNMEVVFGASVAPNTPAGLYAADLSLIATGKF